jgi:hypothetical protein
MGTEGGVRVESDEITPLNQNVHKYVFLSGKVETKLSVAKITNHPLKSVQISQAGSVRLLPLFFACALLQHSRHGHGLEREQHGELRSSYHLPGSSLFRSRTLEFFALRSHSGGEI